MWLIFMQAVGFTTTVVAANGQGSRRDLNVNLTLDRSGPMASSKFCDPMKAAALGLITFMQSASVDYAPTTNFKTQNPTLSWSLEPSFVRIRRPLPRRSGVRTLHSMRGAREQVISKSISRNRLTLIHLMQPAMRRRQSGTTPFTKPRRVANDPTSPIYDSTRPAGKFVFAPDQSALVTAFNAIASEILRLSQ